jgi:SAM-dependent methyltransferase
MLVDSIYSKVCDAEDFFSPELLRALEAIEHVPSLHRKAWEYAMVVRNMGATGALHEGADVLGLACALEPVIYHAARHARSVLATDRYDDATLHSGWAAGKVKVDEVFDKAPFSFPRERLKVQSMDMRRIDAPDESFDLVWSCSSIEHVDTIRDVEAVFREVARVLRPGGLHIFTSEWKFCGGFSYFPNGFIFDLPLLRRTLRDVPLEPLGPFDVRLSKHPLNTPTWRSLRSVINQMSSIVVYTRGVLQSSFVLAQRKSNRTGHAIDVINEDPSVDEWLFERYHEMTRHLASPFTRARLGIDGTLGAWLAQARVGWQDFRGR